MIKADFYLKSVLMCLVDSPYQDSNVRPKYKDGEEAITNFNTHYVFEYDLSQGEFPIPTLRNTAIKTGIREILWIYQLGSNSLEEAGELGVNWWGDWDIGDGTIGERYGRTVSNYNIIQNVLRDLGTNKFSRRHIIDLYQYADFQKSKGLHPCVFLSMFAVREFEGVNYVDLMLVSRSSDFITAGFINQIQYVALLMMIVGHLNYTTDEEWVIGKFTCAINNVHLYQRHIPAAKELLEREPIKEQPKLKLKENKSFWNYTADDFEFVLPKGIEKLNSKLELAV